MYRKQYAVGHQQRLILCAGNLSGQFYVCGWGQNIVVGRGFNATWQSANSKGYYGVNYGF